MLRLLSALLLILVSPVQASGLAESPDFFQGSSPIDSRNDSAREAAIRDALAEVLVRLSGDVSVSVSPQAQALSAEANRFMRSYRYAEELLPADSESAAPRRRQLLRVDFEPNALIRAARSQGLPLWDSRRPLSMVWLLGPTEDGPRQLYSETRIRERLPGLLKAAQRRGLPLALPQMDAQDQAAVSSADVIAEDHQRLQQAAQRYQARHLLLARIERRDQLWYALYSYIQPGQPPIRWRAIAENPNLALDKGFDRYADELASRYVTRVAAGWVQEARLQVFGIQALDGYARVLNFLENNNLVEAVMPVTFVDDAVVFSLRFEGDTADLERSLALSGFLQHEPAPFADSSNGVDPSATGSPSSSANGGLSFYAVALSPQLRYRYLP